MRLGNESAGIALPGFNNGLSQGVAWAKPKRAKSPLVWSQATILAVLLTVTAGAWAFGPGHFILPRASIVAVLSLHAFVLAFPIHHVLRTYKTGRDLLAPGVVAGLTFIIFHLLWNPLVLATANLSLLDSRGLAASSEREFFGSVVGSYMVLLVSWWSLSSGYALYPSRVPKPYVRRRVAAGLAFIPLGLAYVALGAIGNARALGGDFGSYASKMLHFYERWTIYEISSVHGGTINSILQRFLPIGLIVLALGLYFRHGRRRTSLIMWLAAASVANVFLSSATGSRSASFMVVLYSLIAYNHIAGPVSLSGLIGFVGPFLGGMFLLGIARAAVYYRTEIDFAGPVVLMHLSSFMTLNLSNYIGTLYLIEQVNTLGVAFGLTAFAGLTGLLGGPTPVTTQAEVWRRLGLDFVTNPRYGPPGELYFNFGWVGVVVGMILIGMAIKSLQNHYLKNAKERSVSAVIICVYMVMTAHFLVIANLSYVPPYFLLYSIGFAGVWVIMRSTQADRARRRV